MRLCYLLRQLDPDLSVNLVGNLYYAYLQTFRKSYPSRIWMSFETRNTHGLKIGHRFSTVAIN